MAEPSQQELIVEGQNDKLTIAARLKQGGRTVSTLLLAGAMMFPLSAPIEAQATRSISPGSRLDEIRARAPSALACRATILRSDYATKQLVCGKG